MLCGRYVFLTSALLACATAAIYKRQVEDDEQNMSATESVWDGTIRDRNSACQSMAQYAPPKDFCTVFSKCCQMSFDPLNGDKCQEMDTFCNDNTNYGCVYKNCTELITTTTTTTMATTTEKAASATGLLAAVGVLFLLY